MSRTALIASPTGPVGRLLLKRLLAYSACCRVKALSRRPLALQNPKLTGLLTDYQDLSKLGKEFVADDVFYCLGTTLRKASSRAVFERVDYHMAVDLARAAKTAGAKQFIVVSAVGASTRPPAFFSSCVKAPRPPTRR